MAGQRQPLELVQIKGKKHLTKEEIEKRKASEIKANSDSVIAPEYLSKTQKEKFDNIAKELTSINIMSNLDCDLLARFVIASDLYIKFTKQLNNRKTQDSIFELEKVANLQDKYFKQCLSCSKELGLTISSRCKLVIPKKEEEPKSKWDGFMAGGNSG